MPSFWYSWTDAAGMQRRKLVAFDDDGKYLNTAAPEASACRGCDGASDDVRWLGMRWIGTPWPVRHWRRQFGVDAPTDWRGCGCIRRLKIATNELGRVRAAAMHALRAVLPEPFRAASKVRRIIVAWRSDDECSTPDPSSCRMPGAPSAIRSASPQRSAALPTSGTCGSSPRPEARSAAAT